MAGSCHRRGVVKSRKTANLKQVDSLSLGKIDWEGRQGALNNCSNMKGGLLKDKDILSIDI